MSTTLSSVNPIREKVAQATQILNEFDVDLWLTFVRETTLSPDPALELIADVDVTWSSAFLTVENVSMPRPVGALPTVGSRSPSR